MKKYNNSKNTMDAESISKNRASTKRQMNRGYLLTSMTAVLLLLTCVFSFGAEEAASQETNSVLIWGGCIIVGIIVFIYAIYKYDKYLSREFGYEIFSVINFILPIILFLFLLFYYEDLGNVKILGMDVFLVLTILGVLFLYIYNLIKTNWFLAIINVIIILSWIPCIIIYIIESLKSESSTSSNNQINDDQPSKNYYCEYCGRKFESVKDLTRFDFYCHRHPNGQNKGNHKLYEGSEKNEYTCKYCGRKFKSLAELTRFDFYCHRHPNGQNKGNHKPAL